MLYGWPGRGRPWTEAGWLQRALSAQLGQPGIIYN